jgi:hypothetical protein
MGAPTIMTIILSTVAAQLKTASECVGVVQVRSGVRLPVLRSLETSGWNNSDSFATGR